MRLPSLFQAKRRNLIAPRNDLSVRLPRFVREDTFIIEQHDFYQPISNGSVTL